MPLQKINPTSLDISKDFSFANVNVSGSLIVNSVNIGQTIIYGTAASNAAFDRANAAYNAANTATDPWVRTQANNAFNAANAASSTASAAFTQANAAYTLAQAGGGGTTAIYT